MVYEWLICDEQLSSGIASQVQWDPYLVLGHGPHYERAHHARQGAHAIGDAHEDAGVAGGDVQVVYIETCSVERNENVHQPHPKIH